MVTLEQQIKCAARELAMRRNVYPKFVASGRMKQDEADRELAAMQAIIDTLAAQRGVWIVWSHEHDGYWPESRRGYVQTIQEAGRFTYHDALEIIRQASLGMRGRRPQETMMPFPTLPT